MGQSQHPLSRFSAASLILGVFLAVAGCGASVDKAGSVRPADPHVLTLLTPYSSFEVQPFVDAVDQLSGGSLRVDVQALWRSGERESEPDLVHAVAAGHTALGVVSARVWHDLGVRSFDALIAPFAVDSMELQLRVLDSDLVDAMLEGPQEVGVTGLGILPGPLRRPVGVTTELLGPADYRGRTIGVSHSPIASRTFAALEAQAESLALWGASIEEVDGMEAHLGAVSGNQYYEVAQTVTSNVVFWPRPLTVVGNPAALAALDEGQRQIVGEASRQALLPMSEAAREAEAVDQLCRAGALTFLTASADQREGLRTATEPVLAWLRQDEGTRASMDGIASLRAQMRDEGVDAPPLSCSDATGAKSTSQPQASPGGPSLDGTYTVTTTYDDLVAAGTEPGDRVAENFGSWVYVVDGDRFAYTQENGAACSWGYGTLQVQGQTLTVDFIAGGTDRPNSAVTRPGELYGYSWSLYRDTLTLTPLPGFDSPEPFLAKPWMRISRTPSVEQMSSQCPPPAEAFAAQ